MPAVGESWRCLPSLVFGGGGGAQNSVADMAVSFLFGEYVQQGQEMRLTSYILLHSWTQARSSDVQSHKSRLYTARSL